MRLHINLLSAGLAIICFFTSCRHADVENQDLLLSNTKEELSNHIHTLEQKRLPEREKMKMIESLKHTLEMLEMHGESAVTSVPNPYAVSVGIVSGGPTLALVIYYLERDTDVIEVRIREYWQNGDIFSEVYELPLSAVDILQRSKQRSWVNGICFEATERKNSTMRKDEKKWHEWVCGTDQEGLQPPLYVTRPTDKNHVLISLIDKVGHESRAVPLTAWLGD